MRNSWYEDSGDDGISHSGSMPALRWNAVGQQFLVIAERRRRKDDSELKYKKH